MPENEFIIYNCPICGGVSHPATGCAYSENFVVCVRCTKEAWQWLLSHINGKGGRKGIYFYEYAKGTI